uniref:Succinate--CoA ligase [ADP-forming] subunit alpha n=2 Tax=Candidatus Bipolaricaulota TaxID=67810 RepID=H5SI89_9BACT|nr:succinyl-CoA synthetase alpha subunit [uncultured Acetothermia bacterium]BAL57104.1 succinyl-CoA synthetase alpha subunit [uncultured Acetothermia bacterium]BAL58813.1 succinyl-CoA synthetase alpha subunit [Candidatus Acetothermum autotrophicum]
MSILINSNTKVLVQGITGSEGSFHAQRMREYGTQIVAGVTPGKGGSDFEGIPIYNTVAEATQHHTIDASAIFVPAQFAADAILEAADAGIGLIVCITEHIPVHQMLKVVQIVSQKGSRLIGPNCPGVISPGKSKVGILPNHVFKPGPVGIVSRSGTLTYEIADQLSRAGIGQSTVVGIGGDPIIGSSFIDILALFQKDRQTKAVVLVGEIGGTDEERAAEFIAQEMTKPVVAYIAGFSAPPGKRMGHAGAIISGSEGTAEAKAKALEAHGIPVARTPNQVVNLVQSALRRHEANN